MASVLLVPSVVLAQSEAPSVPPASVEPVPVRFAVAPTAPADRTLTLLTTERDCGTSGAHPGATARVTEGELDVAVQVGVLPGPDGQVCGGDDLLRLEVALAEPLGTRPILDGATGEAALVNTVDAPDLGEAYACDFGSGAGPFTVAQLLGPGSDISDLAIPTEIEEPRAMVDEGDLVILRGPFGKEDRIVVETWRLRDGEWQRSHRERACRLMLAGDPVLDAATWRLRDRDPSSDAQVLRIRVHEWACASGQPPVGRIVPPTVDFTKDRITIAVRTYPVTANTRNPAADCPGAPAAPYTVWLHRQLGRRNVYDGAYFPPREVFSTVGTTGGVLPPGEVGQTDVLDRWGPLAVIGGGGGPDARTGHGTLSIGADCVTFTADQTGEEVTLVWGSDRTSWRPQQRQIVSMDSPDGRTRLSDGDRVLFGGMAIAAGGESMQAWLEDAWVQPPDPSCPTGQWYVGDVNLLE
jgi:hypothetical protein